jgi:hypothetical protein
MDFEALCTPSWRTYCCSCSCTHKRRDLLIWSFAVWMIFLHGIHPSSQIEGGTHLCVLGVQAARWVTRVSHNKRGSRSKQGPITDRDEMWRYARNLLILCRRCYRLNPRAYCGRLCFLCFIGQGDTKKGTCLQRHLDWMLWLCRELSGHGNSLTRNSVLHIASLVISIGSPLHVMEFIWGLLSEVGPPLWSSGQSSWLQIRRPGFDSRHYQKKT